MQTGVEYSFSQCFPSGVASSALPTALASLPLASVVSDYGYQNPGPSGSGSMTFFISVNGAFQEVQCSANIDYIFAKDSSGQPLAQSTISSANGGQSIALTYACFLVAPVPTAVQTWAPYNGGQTASSTDVDSAVAPLLNAALVPSVNGGVSLPYANDSYRVVFPIPYNASNAGVVQSAFSAALSAEVGQVFATPADFYSAITQSMTANAALQALLSSGAPVGTPTTAATKAPSTGPNTPAVSSVSVAGLTPVVGQPGGLGNYAYVTCSEQDGQQVCTAHFVNGPLAQIPVGSAISATNYNFDSQFVEPPFTALGDNTAYTQPQTAFPPSFPTNYSWATPNGIYFVGADGIYRLRYDLKTIDPVWTNPSLSGPTAVITISQFYMLTPLCAIMILSDGSGWSTTDGFQSVQPLLFPNPNWKEIFWLASQSAGAATGNWIFEGVQAILLGAGAGIRLIYNFRWQVNSTYDTYTYEEIYIQVDYYLENGILNYKRSNSWPSELYFQEYTTQSMLSEPPSNEFPGALINYRTPGVFLGYSPTQAVYFSAGDPYNGQANSGVYDPILNITPPSPRSQFVLTDNTGAFSSIKGSDGAAGPEYDDYSVNETGVVSLTPQTNPPGSAYTSIATTVSLPAWAFSGWRLMPNQVQKYFGLASAIRGQ